ncbi:MAG: hypothetical protein CMJ18_11905 [Phycisphaeraceae bacterium]|nr:hypothetical protein [Phycisphaeraceae bacterium]
MINVSIDSARSLYEVDGFCLFPEPVIPADVVERAVDGMDAIRRGEYDTDTPPQGSHWKPGDDPDALCKIECPHHASRAIMDLVRHPALGDLVGAVTGADWVQVWWVQLLYKPPSDDNLANIGWHADRQYWNVAWDISRSDLFTAWIALSDVTSDSGPMRFVPGTHKVDFGDAGDFWGQDLDALRDTIPMPDGMSWREVEAVLRPGGVSIHDMRTLHGSGPNRTSGPRRSFAIHMRTNRSETNEESNLTRFIDDEVKAPIIYRK